MEANQVCVFHDVGCQFQCGSESELKTHMESDIIPHQMATVSAFKRVMNETHDLQQKQTNMENRVVQLNRFIKMHARQQSITERLVNDWFECVSSTTVDSNQHLATELVNSNYTYWRSDGDEGSHWIRLKMQDGVLVYRLFMRMENRFPSYRPTYVSIRGGPHPDQLTSISPKTKINVNEDMVLIIKDVVEYYEYIQIDIETGHGQRDCVVQGLVMVGYMA